MSMFNRIPPPLPSCAHYEKQLFNSKNSIVGAFNSSIGSHKLGTPHYHIQKIRRSEQHPQQRFKCWLSVASSSNSIVNAYVATGVSTSKRGAKRAAAYKFAQFLIREGKLKESDIPRVYSSSAMEISSYAKAAPGSPPPSKSTSAAVAVDHNNDSNSDDNSDDDNDVEEMWPDVDTESDEWYDVDDDYTMDDCKEDNKLNNESFDHQQEQPPQVLGDNDHVQSEQIPHAPIASAPVLPVEGGLQQAPIAPPPITIVPQRLQRPFFPTSWHVNKWLNEQMDNNTAQWPGHHAMYSIRLTPFNYGITPSAVFTWLAWSLSDFGHDHGYVMHQLNRVVFMVRKGNGDQGMHGHGDEYDYCVFVATKHKWALNKLYRLIYGTPLIYQGHVTQIAICDKPTMISEWMN